ncbi:MAG: hemerythrin family protein [Aquificae bacterium]|nr:hemerythrin family protein [Aquificota bacterium]
MKGDIISWSEEMELGIPEIDQQHRKLVNMLNEFYHELEEGHREEAVKHFLKELEDYLRYHFEYEESLLQRVGYPDTANHRRTHEMFKKLYREEVEKFLKGDRKALRELVAFTLSWLYTHIMKTDRKYANYMKEKGLV